MNMEKPIHVDVRDLTHALDDASAKAKELRTKAEKMKEDARFIQAEAAGWEGAAEIMRKRLEMLATKARTHAG